MKLWTLLLSGLFLWAACDSDAPEGPEPDLSDAIEDTSDVEDVEQSTEEVGPTAPDDGEGKAELAGDDVPEDRILAYVYDSDEKGSVLYVSALGDLESVERQCCPEEEESPELAPLASTELADLRADMMAVIHTNQTVVESTGALQDGASLGGIVIYDGGYAYTVLSYYDEEVEEEVRDLTSSDEDATVWVTINKRFRKRSLADDAVNRIIEFVNLRAEHRIKR